MRRAARRLAVAALLALAPEAARAFAWTLQTGVDYQRLDTESATGETATFPRLDVNLKLDLGGVSPDRYNWSAGVGFRRLDVSQGGAGNVRDELTYALRTSLFTDPRSAVSLDAHASRSDESASLEGISSTQVHSTAYGAELRLNAVERPFLVASYAFAGSEYENPALGPTDRSIESFSATTGHGSSSYTYRGTYRLNRSEGTFALDDYDDHRVDVLAHARIADAAKVAITDTYYLRAPREDTTLAPRLESNAFVANVGTYEAKKNVQSLTYAYSRAARTSPSAEDVRTSQRLAYALERYLPDPEWRIRGQLRLSYADDRIGGEEHRTGGESLAFLATWRRERAAGDRSDVHAGPTIALLHPGGGDTRLGYGATAGANLSRAFGSVQTFGSYDASYTSDVDAEAGWILTQTAMGTATGRLGLGTLQGSLQLSAQRRESPLLGGAATRSVTLMSSYGWRRGELLLQGTLQDGGTADGVQDALFLAPGFDSHHRSLVFGASMSPFTFLNLRGRVRYLVTDLPDRPATDEKEAFAAVELVYGSLRIALEDRYVVAGTEAGETRFNQVFVRAYRAFGGRY